MLLCMMLAMAFTVAGCGSKAEGTADAQKNTETAIVNTETIVETEAVAETESVDAAMAQEIILGEGSVKFTFMVDADGNETNFVVSTDKETVGDALLELNLIEGDDSEYGLYVKTVNGITADYDTDGTYWAFYVNGEYASTGVYLWNYCRMCICLEFLQFLLHLFIGKRHCIRFTRMYY